VLRVDVDGFPVESLSIIDKLFFFYIYKIVLLFLLLLSFILYNMIKYVPTSGVRDGCDCGSADCGVQPIEK